MQYSPKSKERAIKLITKKLEESFDVNAMATLGIPIHKVICHILDLYKRGNFYGTVAVKITGTSIHDPKEVDVTHKLDLDYNLDSGD